MDGLRLKRLEKNADIHRLHWQKLLEYQKVLLQCGKQEKETQNLKP